MEACTDSAYVRANLHNLTRVCRVATREHSGWVCFFKTSCGLEVSRVWCEVFKEIKLPQIMQANVLTRSPILPMCEL